MSYPCIRIEAKAGQDHSANNRLWVTVDGSDGENVDLAASGTDTTLLGILFNAPEDDGRAYVTLGGITEGIAGEALEPFDLITVGSDGRCDKAAEGELICGMYVPAPEDGSLPDAADGDVIRVLVYANKRTYIGPRFLYGEGTIDFSGILDGNEETGTITVTGAAVGDAVVPAPPAVDDGIGIVMHVSAANTVTVTALNNSGGTIDIASGTYGAYVLKRNTA